MPLYDYHCSACDVTVEELRSVTEMGSLPNPACPKCQNPMALKLSAPATPRIGIPKGYQSAREWAQKRGEQAQKRSKEHAESKAGKVQKEAAEDRQRVRGNLPKLP